jgi:putative transposase
MANTYTQIYIQFVFAVKNRQNLIAKHNKEELHKYILGIVDQRDQKLLAIYCMPDHIHMFVSLGPNILISNFMRDVKAGSSKFINDKKWVQVNFEWQLGYGAFSYSHSQIDSVVKYINNQEQHHLKTSFKDEYVGFLKRFNVEYNDKYLFDWL